MQREERGDFEYKRIDHLVVIKPIGYQESRGWVWRVRCPCGHHRAIAQRNLIELAKYSKCPKCHYKPEVPIEQTTHN